MKTIINKLFNRRKLNPHLTEPPIPEDDYLSLLNHLNRKSGLVEPQEAIEFISKKYEEEKIDLVTKERLICFFLFFKKLWQEAYERALPLATTQPYDQDMVGLITSILNESGKFKDAYDFIKKFSAEDQILNKESYFLTKGQISWNSGNTDDAIDSLNRVLEINPDNPSALNIFRGIYSENGDAEKESLMRAKLFDLHQDNEDVIFFDSMHTIGAGDLAIGWKNYEHRYKSSLAKNYFRVEALDSPRWDGRPLNSKQLLFVYFEQGLGDTLMSCRYLSQAIQLCPNIIAECQPEARDLLQSNFPEITVFSSSLSVPLDFEFDFWIGAMSFPAIFSNQSNIYDPRGDYLHIAPSNLHSPFDTMPLISPKIGISWSGNPAHPNDSRRSLNWGLVKRTLAKSRFSFYAIQTNIPEDKPENIIDISDYLITLSDTAEIIQQLDLIITVDTSLVHLAGAINKRTWLLCAFKPEWRWGTAEGESSLYQSVTMFKQKHFNDQQELFERIILSELETFFPENKPC